MEQIPRKVVNCLLPNFLKMTFEIIVVPERRLPVSLPHSNPHGMLQDAGAEVCLDATVTQKVLPVSFYNDLPKSHYRHPLNTTPRGIGQ